MYFSVLLVNTACHKCVCFTSQEKRPGDSVDSSERIFCVIVKIFGKPTLCFLCSGFTPDEIQRSRLESLCSFYATAAPLLANTSPSESDDVATADDAFSHDVTDVYRCHATEKCYALQDGDRQVFFVTSSETPMFALRYMYMQKLFSIQFIFLTLSSSYSRSDNLERKC